MIFAFIENIMFVIVERWDKEIDGKPDSLICSVQCPFIHFNGTSEVEVKKHLTLSVPSFGQLSNSFPRRALRPKRAEESF